MKCPHCGNMKAQFRADNGCAKGKGLLYLCTKPVEEGETDSCDRDAAQAMAEGATEFICGMQWDPEELDEEGNP